MQKAGDSWSGRTGFILAAVASAVGLGSVWKFPYEVGANGGGAFVLFYVVGLTLIVVPLLLAEFAIGRRGAADAASSIENVAAAHGASTSWAWVGMLGVLAGTLILSFYSVIGGWTMAYVVDTGVNGLAGDSSVAVRARYDALLAAPLRMAAYHAAFLALAAGVVTRGVSGGIEKASTLLMPLLVILMLGLAVYSASQGGLGSTLRFLFHIELSTFTARAALEALGLGFFSIGVGIGAMITYAAYAGRNINLAQAAFISVIADSAISILAGFAVFPLVFANNLDPASGPGLVFVTLPISFARMPFGAVAAFAFFVLLFVAAFGSAISMLEVGVSLLSRRYGWRRSTASMALAGACFAIGLATVLSFNVWSDWHPLGALPAFASATVFDLLDHLTSNALLPIGAFVLSIFCGWVIPPSVLAEELGLAPRGAALLRVLLRWVAPAGIAAATLGPMV